MALQPLRACNAATTFLFPFLLAFCVAGCASPESDWERARGQDSIPGYQQFLAHYPDSDHTSEARDEIAWKEVESSPTNEDYASFIAQHANNPHVGQARNAIEQMAWDEAQASDTAASYIRYRNAYPDGKHVRQATERLAVAKAGEDESAKKREEANRRPITLVQTTISKNEWFLSGQMQDDGSGPRYGTVQRAPENGMEFVVLELTPAPGASISVSGGDVFLTSPNGERFKGVYRSPFFSRTMVWDAVSQVRGDALSSAVGAEPTFLFIAPEGANIKTFTLNLGRRQFDLGKF